MLSIEKYQQEFIAYLSNYTTTKEPLGLYEPINYILNLGGKRLRPVLTLMATDSFNGNYKNALNAALSIEIFHNFSLVHDDIMDDAPLRRGHKTVHEKWNINTGILSGDAMLIMAYQLFENYKPEIFQSLAKLFSNTALKVCEGQQFDVDFETRNNVTIPDYLKMIEYKTAVLIGAALKMGAIVANATENDQNNIYEFGKNLGIAFQLQDDYLDAFGDPKTFGKQVGGDIIENKKTFLYLKALEFASKPEKEHLLRLYNEKPVDNLYKIDQVKLLFLTTGSAEATQQEIKNYTDNALKVLDALTISEDKKELLKTFAKKLMTRTI
ncbi:polyprenyl synthetase family protein [Flavobacteriaceae bacterium XHP0103]|uniref:polyprenyl synthetase family protein n=1 Tax=Marixanthotalea marina TaxID=2844359 RepID=UPI00298A0313|nr:polyprenyl synthetase family protein [Marixanthotalea marina]MBU3822190.1 polyprenyl synthetase family protein [Marixanthotalea marina]